LPPLRTPREAPGGNGHTPAKVLPDGGSPPRRSFNAQNRRSVFSNSLH